MKAETDYNPIIIGAGAAGLAGETIHESSLAIETRLLASRLARPGHAYSAGAQATRPAAIRLIRPEETHL